MRTHLADPIGGVAVPALALRSGTVLFVARRRVDAVVDRRTLFGDRVTHDAALVAYRVDVGALATDPFLVHSRDGTRLFAAWPVILALSRRVGSTAVVVIAGVVHLDLVTRRHAQFAHLILFVVQISAGLARPETVVVVNGLVEGGVVNLEIRIGARRVRVRRSSASTARLEHGTVVVLIRFRLSSTITVTYGRKGFMLPGKLADLARLLPVWIGGERALVTRPQAVRAGSRSTAHGCILRRSGMCRTERPIRLGIN